MNKFVSYINIRARNVTRSAHPPCQPRAGESHAGSSDLLASDAPVAASINRSSFSLLRSPHQREPLRRSHSAQADTAQGQTYRNTLSIRRKYITNNERKYNAINTIITYTRHSACIEIVYENYAAD